ncbi:glutathionylspermidine synthase [Natronospira proteinivora]|uniref:Glutathionylspermidine synthase n=1 Tax=Natronospira proteinivora TaxID=1807133 RepID=A0ABT1G875_9GAMM|nr:glutathionylspermidine synthase family protein [Natronospira proteinivora]MCP1727505.1 glutathionylspermidine synthase [Natronospira proteinivora]
MRTEPWPLEPADATRLLQRFRAEHYKWDIYHDGEPTLLPDAIILSREEHEFLVEAAESAWSALRELESRVCADERYLEAVGVPSALWPAIQQQPVDQPRVSRCDFHYSSDERWYITEFNEDCPGEMGECAGYQALMSEYVLPWMSGLSCPGDLRQSLIKALSPWQRIGLVHASAWSGDLQQVSLIADWLRQSGREAVVGSPANLQVDADGQAWLFDQAVDVLFRYYPGEWISELPNAADWERLACQHPLMSPLSALASQSKRFYALAEVESLGLSERARDCLSTWFPDSVLPEPAHQDDYLRDQSSWVLKGSFGRMGNAVRIGALLSPNDWRLAINQALTKPAAYALQAAFEPAPLWFSSGARYASLGMFLVNGRFAGYSSRVHVHPIINYEACHVATLVETT